MVHNFYDCADCVTLRSQPILWPASADEWNSPQHQCFSNELQCKKMHNCPHAVEDTINLFSEFKWKQMDCRRKYFPLDVDHSSSELFLSSWACSRRPTADSSKFLATSALCKVVEKWLNARLGSLSGLDKLQAVMKHCICNSGLKNRC